jgi:NADP-dependent 3-hydroxy acid dehydrogenase YdfG
MRLSTEDVVGRFEGKVVWITGGGSGIGEAAALAFAKEGASLVLTGRRREPLEEVAARIRDLGTTAHIQQGDLMQPAEVRRIGAFIASEIGRLDIRACRKLWRRPHDGLC